MSIRRLVQLVVDRNAAKKAERETQASLRKGTDANVPKKNLGIIQRGLNGITDAAKRAGTALVAAFAIGKLKQYGQAALEAFGRQERSILKVNSALVNMGKFSDESSKKLQDNASALQRVTEAGDEAILEATASIAELATELSVGELAKSQEAVIAIADTFFDGNLASAAALVAKTIGSSTNALARYGIELDTSASQSEKLNQIVEKAAPLFRTSMRAAADLEGRNRQLSNSWGDLQEVIGGILVDGLNLVDRLVDLRERVDGASDALTRNQSYIVGWMRTVVSAAQAAFESVRFVMRVLFNFGQVVGSGIELAALQLQKRFGPVLNGIVDLLDRIPGVDIPIRMNELTPEEFRAEYKRLTGAISRDTTDVADAVWDLGDAYRNVGAAARDAVMGTGGGGESSEAPGTAGGNTPPARQLAPSVRKAFGGDLDPDFLADAVEPAVENVRSLIEHMNPLEGLMEQTDLTAAYMREGFRGVGESIVQQLTMGRAEEQFASGLAALASGTWPPNPAALSAAGKHFAAAAAFRTIGAKFSGSSRSGGLSARPAIGGVGASTPTSTGPSGTELNVFLDPLSPADPRYQLATLGAYENGRERYGDRVKVNVYPRTGAGI